MNDHKLICNEPNGYFSLIFKNQTGLSNEEILDIFGEYGKVAHIIVTGNSTGFRFVKYKYLEEAQNAVEGLKNHKFIKLDIPRGVQNDRQNINTNKKYPKMDKKNSKYQKQLVNTISKEPETNTNGFVPSNITNKKYNSFPLVDENVSFTKTNSNRNSSQTCENSEESSISDFVNDESDNNIPNLTSGRGKLKFQNPTRKIFVNAKEVIVGNIHPNYGSPYILHLFDNFEPIAISEIKLIKVSSIRYCHVYFKNSIDSTEVEKQFDRVALGGQNLIVLSPQNLIKEAESTTR